MRLDQALCSIESPHDGYYLLPYVTHCVGHAEPMAGVRQARQCDNAAGTSQMSDVRGGGEEEEEATAAAATAGQHRLCQWPQERSA